jgi:hypothetical protein
MSLWDIRVWLLFAKSVKLDSAQVRTRSQINVGKVTIHIQRSVLMKTGSSSLNVDLWSRSVHVHTHTHTHTKSALQSCHFLQHKSSATVRAVGSWLFHGAGRGSILEQSTYNLMDKWHYDKLSPYTSVSPFGIAAPISDTYSFMYHRRHAYYINGNVVE